MKDFGFNAVSLEELNLFQEQQETLAATEAEASAKHEVLIELRQAVQPLLENLKADPEKEYILWPNRAPKIAEFEQFLDSIVAKA